MEEVGPEMLSTTNYGSQFAVNRGPRLGAGATNVNASSRQVQPFHQELESAVLSLSDQDKDWSTLVKAWSARKR